MRFISCIYAKTSLPQKNEVLAHTGRGMRLTTDPMDATLPAGDGCGETGDGVPVAFHAVPCCGSCCCCPLLYGDGACITPLDLLA